MRRFLFSLLLLFTLSPVKGGELPVISLITCDSGDELYSTFGHSALRVHFMDDERDYVYNFGLFDFSTPNFYWKFMRGKLQYMLGVQYMQDFMLQYQYENREVVEQILDIDSLQIDALLQRLNYLYLPQNRYYYYSFLYKNCTSELRDLIYPLVPGSKDVFISINANTTDRELINRYINGWTRFGINLILGSNLDKEISLYQSMFLPQNLQLGLRELNNNQNPIVKQEMLLLSKGENIAEGNNLNKSAISRILDKLLSPFFTSLLLLFLVLLSLFFRKNRVLRWIPSFYLTLISILGFTLSFIILVTEHQELYKNYNLLWCNPFFFFVLLSGWMGYKKTERALSALSLLFLSTLQLIWALNIQYFEPPFFVIAFTIAIIMVSKIFNQTTLKVVQK